MNVNELRKVIEGLDGEVKIKFVYKSGDKYDGFVGESDNSLKGKFKKKENMLVFVGKEDVYNGIRCENDSEYSFERSF